MIAGGRLSGSAGRMTRSRGLAVWVGAVLAVLWCYPVRANTLTYGPDPHYSGLLDLFTGLNTGSFTYPQFDDAGGSLMLNKVTLTVEVVTVSGRHAFDNESGAGATITLAIGSQVRVKGPLPFIGSQLIVNPDATETTTGFVGPDSEPGSGPADFAGTDYLSITGSGTTDTRLAFKTSSFDLAPYLGTGDVTFDFDGGTSTTGTSALPSPGANLVEASSWMFYTTLDYEYTEVPEPGALTLFLLGAPFALRRFLKRP
ncbi:MAG: hypothetical protein DME25_05885 [Verrucomicrobia bacterium]|nr:MAG: hypothetical protein DME25_05885 [Verrucomicrobiota bacterium]